MKHVRMVSVHPVAEVRSRGKTLFVAVLAQGQAWACTSGLSDGRAGGAWPYAGVAVGAVGPEVLLEA